MRRSGLLGMLLGESEPAPAYIVTDGVDERVVVSDAPAGSGDHSVGAWIYSSSWSTLPLTRQIGTNFGQAPRSAFTMRGSSPILRVQMALPSHSPTSERAEAPALMATLSPGWHLFGGAADDTLGVTTLFVDGVTVQVGGGGSNGWDRTAGMAWACDALNYYAVERMRGVFDAGTLFAEADFAAIHALGPAATASALTSTILGIDAAARVWPVTVADGPAGIAETTGNGSTATVENMEAGDFVAF